MLAMSATTSPTKGILEKSPTVSPETSPGGPGLPAGASVIPLQTPSLVDTAPVPVGEIRTRLQVAMKMVDDYERTKWKHEAMTNDLKIKTKEQDEVFNQFKFQFKLDTAANFEKNVQNIIAKNLKTITRYIFKTKDMENKFRVLEEKYKYSDKVNDMNEKFL